MNEKKNNIMVHQIPVKDISPNPHQPRVDFNEQNLSSLAESIRQYGVMQPIIVTRKDQDTFELIAGERRLRASKIAGKETIPAIVRNHEHSDSEKFELAIIENLQREDLNPIDKAKSFKKLVEEFNLTHGDIAQKMGKSREYISNSLRILMLPDDFLDAMVQGGISEGHARPLLMLKDRPYEQKELFRKIIENKLTVRAAEKIARSLAIERLRKHESEEDSDLKKMEKKLAEKLGTKVSIDKKVSGEGGRLTIEYFSKEDLEKIIKLVKGEGLSSAPVLENIKKDQEYIVEKFDDNFSPKVGKQSLDDFSQKKPEFFSEEIDNLAEDKNTKMDNNLTEMSNLGQEDDYKSEITKTEVEVDNKFKDFNTIYPNDNSQKDELEKVKIIDVNTSEKSKVSLSHDIPNISTNQSKKPEEIDNLAENKNIKMEKDLTELGNFDQEVDYKKETKKTEAEFNSSLEGSNIISFNESSQKKEEEKVEIVNVNTSEKPKISLSHDMPSVSIEQSEKPEEIDNLAEDKNTKIGNNLTEMSNLGQEDDYKSEITKTEVEVDNKFEGFNITSFNENSQEEEKEKVENMNVNTSEKPEEIEQFEQVEKMVEGVDKKPEKKFYGDVFSSFGKISNFGFSKNKEVIQPEPTHIKNMESMDTVEPQGVDTNTMKNVSQEKEVIQPEPTHIKNMESMDTVEPQGVDTNTMKNVSQEKEVIQPEPTHIKNMESMDTVEPQGVDINVMKNVSQEDDVEKTTVKNNIDSKNQYVENVEVESKLPQVGNRSVENSQKSEAQKRIDAILSGTTTTNEIYNMDKVEDSHSIPVVPMDDFEKKQEKDSIEESSVYKQFLQSKERVKEEIEEEEYKKLKESLNSEKIKEEVRGEIKEENTFYQDPKDSTVNINQKQSSNFSKENIGFAHNTSTNNYKVDTDITQKEDVPAARSGEEMLDDNEGNVDIMFSGGDFAPNKTDVKVDTEIKTEDEKEKYNFSI